MNPRAHLAEVVSRMAAIQAEVAEIDDLDTPTEDDAARAETLESEFSELDAERAKLEETIAKRDAVRSASLNPVNVEKPAFRAPDVIVRTNLDPFADISAVRAQMPADIVSRAASAIESIPSHEMSDEAKEGATRSIEKGTRSAREIARHVLVYGTPEYRSAFDKYMTSPASFQVTLTEGERAAFAEAESYRAAMSLTDANGGYLVPFTLDPTIHLTNDGVVNPIRMVARSTQITTDNWNGVTSAGVTAEWLAEATEAADASPTVGNTVITPGKAAAYIQASFEVMADGNIAAQVGSLIADAKDRLEGAAFALGSGSGRPHGVIDALVDASKTVTSTTTDTFAVADVYKTLNAVPARHRRSNAVWIANLATINAIRAFDTYGGSSFWANLGGGQPEQLLGYNIYECSDMDGVINAAAENYILGFFDPSEYLIVDRVGTTLVYDPLVKGANRRPTGEAGWFAYWRVGADLTNTNAGRVLNVT